MVKGLQMLKDQPAFLSVLLIGRLFQVFGCECAVETLHERVVVTIVFATLIHDNTILSQQPLIALIDGIFYHGPSERSNKPDADVPELGASRFSPERLRGVHS